MDIRLENITVKRSGRLILDDISLTLKSGSFTMLLGCNGAGKTTLIRTVTGLLKADSGAVFYGDTDIRKLSLKSRAKMAAYLPQINENNVRLSAFDYVSTGLAPYGGMLSAPPADYIPRTQKVLEEYGIYGLNDRLFTTLSGGEKQLCRLAKADLQNAEWLILDEPDTALDYGNSRSLFQIIQQKTESGKSAVASVHNPDTALKYGTRIIVLYGGKIYADIEKSAPAFQQQFENAMRRLYGDISVKEYEGKYFISD